MNTEVQQTQKISKIGIYTRTLLFLITICYIGTYITPTLSLVYSNIPIFTFLKFELYRLITGLLISESLFEYAFNIFIIITIFNYWENKEGTSKFFIKISINMLIIQISMLILYLLLCYFFPIVLSFKIKIVPSLGIAFLVKHMLLTSTKNIAVYRGQVINDRLLIVIYLICFLIMNGKEFKVELWLSFYYGFLMCKFPKIYDVELISEETILHFEKNENYLFVVGIDSWIPIDESYIKKSGVNISDIEDIKEIALDREDNKIEIMDTANTNDTTNTN